MQREGRRRGWRQRETETEIETEAMRGSGEIQRREERGSDEDWRRREDEGKIGKGRENWGMLSVLEGQ